MFVVQSEKENILKLWKSFSEKNTPGVSFHWNKKNDVNRKDLTPDQCSTLLNQTTNAAKEALLNSCPNRLTNS